MTYTADDGGYHATVEYHGDVVHPAPVHAPALVHAPAPPPARPVITAVASPPLLPELYVEPDTGPLKLEPVEEPAPAPAPVYAPKYRYSPTPYPAPAPAPRRLHHGHIAALGPPLKHEVYKGKLKFIDKP